MKAALLPIDTRERHLPVARALEGLQTVLDVGGRPGELAAFLPRNRVRTLNVDRPADLVFAGESLPFADDSFDAVTSLDVLEHLDRSRRRAHLEELVRVARARVVVCCPLGSEEHVKAERELAHWYRSVTGSQHEFLEDHLLMGLPREEELRGLVAGLALSFELAFHGDFRRTNRLFRLGTEARRLKPGALAAYARELVRRPEVELLERPSRSTNRAFLFGKAP